MPATKLSPSQLIAAAKAPILAFNDKNWQALKALLTPDFAYDEVATGRKAQGIDPALALMQGWAAAFPDSRATFHHAHAGGDTVVLEVTWRGTHQGALQTPRGTIPASGKPVELRSCIVCEMAGEKAKSERQYFDMGTMLAQIGAMGR
jgi:steroid delta-isomerase-like uncharacterized protein